MSRWIVSFFLAAVVASLASAQDRPGGSLVLDLENRENVVASRLEGKWQPVRSRLDDYGEPRNGYRALTFTIDKSAVPEKVLRDLVSKARVDLTVYAVGHVQGLRAAKVPYFLTVWQGSPKVFWFRERNKDPFGDTESFNVMLAVGSETGNDLLFRGGDFNNQAFVAYERASDPLLDEKEFRAAVDDLEKVLAALTGMPHSWPWTKA